MSDKLLVEIDMFNGEINDAIPALIYVANELVETSTFRISTPVIWNEKKGSDYQVKWRIAEEELTNWQIPINADVVYQLANVLDKISANLPQETIPELSLKAISDLKLQLEKHLESNPLIDESGT